jgi:hypothetical protein
MGRYYSNLPVYDNSSTIAYLQSTSHVVPFVVNEQLSCDFIRIFWVGNVLAASTTAATTGAATFSCGYTKTHNFVLYSRGSGANSSSLQYYYSTSFVEQFSNNIACAANSTQFSYSNRYTYPCSTGSTLFTNDYSSSAASINQNSASATAYTGTKMIDFQFATTLAAQGWWLAYGGSTSTATQSAGTTIGLRNAVTFNPVFLTQTALSIGVLGAATTNNLMPQYGVGSFTTAGGGTTSSIPLANITHSANHPIMYFQLMRTN